VARNLTGKSKLEFGGGQSTVWWADRARRFDVDVIDGLDRRLLVPLACELLARVASSSATTPRATGSTMH
jgi:hypothetical protein